MADYLRESGVKWIWEKIKTLLSAKQDKLVSGTNIKTINGNSLLGSGDVNISGGSGGDFNSSGTYPNLTAGKATKLATARKIGLTGGAVGTATAFDGSKDISIPVTKVNSNVVTWSRDAAMSTPPITVLAKMGNNNVLAFFKPSALSVEYSTDNGNSWLDYGLTDKEKTHLTTPMVGYRNIYLGKQSGNTNLSSDNKLRITFDFIEGEIRAAIKQLLIKFQNGPSSTSYYYIKISYELYKNYKTDTWISTDDVRVTTNGYITFSTINFNSYDDPMFGYPYQGATYPARMRVEFFRTVADTYNLNISNFIAITSDVPSAPNNMAKMSLPCSLDWQQNATFPANVKGKKLVTDGGTNQQAVLGDGSLIPLSELSPITDADAEILLDNHIHSINVNTNGNYVNISVIKSSKNGNNWETEDNDIPIPLAATTSAGVMSKEDKAKLDGGNVAIDDDSGMPDLIGDYYDDVDMVAEISLRQYYQPLTEGCLYLMNAIEGGSQCIIMFIYRSDGCIPISTTNTNTMKASISGTTLKITGTDGSGELRIKQIKLK